MARYVRIETGFGTLLAAYEPDADGRIVATQLNGDEGAFLRQMIETTGEPPALELDAPASITQTVNAALERNVDLGCVNLSTLTPFQQRVLEATAAIPRGFPRTPHHRERFGHHLGRWRKAHHLSCHGRRGS